MTAPFIQGVAVTAIFGGMLGMLFTRREGFRIAFSVLRGAMWSLAVTAGMFVFDLYYYEYPCLQRPDELTCLAEWDRETKAMEARFAERSSR